MTLFDPTLADLQLLLVDRNNLFLSLGTSGGRRARRGLPADIPRSLARVDASPAGIAPLRGVIVDVDRITPLKHLHGAIMLASSYPNDQDRMPTAQRFRIKMRVFIPPGVAFTGSPVVE